MAHQLKENLFLSQDERGFFIAHIPVVVCDCDKIYLTIGFGGINMNCVKCGNPLGEGAAFCTNCGNPAGGTPQAAQAGTTINVTYDSSSQQVIPYEPPVMQDGKLIVPLHRRYRILCPDCRRVSNDIKSDATAGYACPVCGKAYAYAGQLLVYRMGSFHPLYVARQINIMIDGVDYGQIANQESVRIMLTPGSHIVACSSYGLRNPMSYKIDVSPENNTFAFKFNLIYNGPFTYPGKGTSNEFKPCLPEEIPNI